jgi:hypothetical protein
MKFLTRRPVVFLWAMSLALFLAQAHHHRGGRGFHEW